MSGVSEVSKRRSFFHRDSTLVSFFRNRLQAHPVWRKSERIVDGILESFNFSQERKVKQQAKANAFLRLLFPQILRDNRKVKNTWPRAGYDSSIPKLSRGFNGKPGGEQLGEARRSMKRKSEEDEGFKQKDEIETAFKRLAKEHKENTERKIYGSPLEGLSGKKRQAEEKDLGLPPPRRCRLSCPLPPPDFVPVETKEFLPNYQAASVRFSFLPREMERYKNDEQEYYTCKKCEPLREPESKIKITPPPTDKAFKNYPGVHPLKSQLYSFPQATTPQMKALLFDPEFLTLKYSAVNAPTHIHKDEVLVQVSYSGVCGTDLFITEGKVSCSEVPVILGHEISGKVFASGRNVDHVKPGDNVAINPYTSCSVCRYCTRGQLSSCVTEGSNNSVGVYKNGGWAEYVVVNKTQVHQIPPQLGLDQAALIHPLSRVLSAMTKLNISTEMDILIQGLDLAGCLWASVFHRRGHRNVFVSEKCKKKRERFLYLNLGYSFIPPEDIGRFNADIVIECSCSPSAVERSLHILNPNGQMCFFGKPCPETEIRCLPYEIACKDITIFGSSGNAFCFSEAIDLAATLGYRYLDFEKLGIRVFDIKDFQDAFRLNKSGDVGKIMFKFES